MKPVPPAVAAVRVAVGWPVTKLRLESPTLVVAADGESWEVTTPPFRGLMAPAEPLVLIVARPVTDSFVRPVWVGEIPGRGFMRLDSEESLAQFFAANPQLPCETRARLIAINLSPRGGERVLFDDEEVSTALAELAAHVPPEARPFVCRDGAAPEWALEFLGVVLQRSNPHEPYRLSVARWQVAFEQGPNPDLAWRREEFVSDAVLERYRTD